jgi:hypothetical protein
LSRFLMSSDCTYACRLSPQCENSSDMGQHTSTLQKAREEAQKLVSVADEQPLDDVRLVGIGYKDLHSWEKKK